jgi:sulfite dehydrogenase (quinone) subunit SoeC
MHPAFSVIFFTTASGAGYGLLALVGIAAPLGLLPHDQGFGALVMGLALGLITFGLLSSTAHLGRPERAWRAFSQWRTSWLSREGILSVATYIPALLFAAEWILSGRLSLIAGFNMAGLAAVTIYCTAMIYSSLKPIPAWHNAWVPRSYAALGLMTGSLALNALTYLWGIAQPWLAVLAIVSTLAALFVKMRYWRFIDTTSGPSTAQTATGLKGKVRFLDGPHTEENYLLREMGYAIARKHSRRLRRIAVILGFVVPLVLTILGLVGSGTLAVLASVPAIFFSLLGVLVERWLFFAEAKHTVTLYYGATTA